MGTTFRPYHPDQILMLPPDLREWVSEGHLAHHVSDLVDAADLSAFYGPYRGDGRRNSPYDPRMMVKVLIYAYATGTFSSRKMARKLEEDVAFRMLAAGNFPKHRTLCEFRKRHLGDFRAVFAEVVRLARTLGLAGFGRVRQGVGGRNEGSGEREQAQGDELRADGHRGTAAGGGDQGVGGQGRGSGRSGRRALRRGRSGRRTAGGAEAAGGPAGGDPGGEGAAGGRAEGEGRRTGPHAGTGAPYKREYGEPDEKAQSNFTDPESRIMKTSSEGYQQCYNAQTVVEGENQLVVGAAVTDNASDQGQLVPMVDAVAQEYGETPAQVLADTGYCNEQDLLELEEQGIDGYVALAREGKAAPTVDKEEYPAKARMAEKLAGEDGRRRYARRKWQAEAPIGWIKEVMGFRRFSFRGLEKVQAEWTLVCLALNVKRLHTLHAA